MPSSKNYVRDYKQEARAESPARQKARRERIVARRNYEAVHGPIPPGMEVDHVKPLSKGGSNKPKNTHLQSAKSNHSYPRTKTGAIRGKYD
jgi:5-methylcytosine-specific restriction endonuclease McrA